MTDSDLVQPDFVEHAGRMRERVHPQPGELWLNPDADLPVIVTKRTAGRLTFVKPQADEPCYRESYVGSEFTFAPDEHGPGWVRLWPRPAARDGS